MSKFLVVKVGGSILRDSRSYLDVASKIANYPITPNKALIVVVSAAKGVTDNLINACEGDKASLEKVVNFYLEVARDVGGYNLEIAIQKYLKELEGLVRSTTACEGLFKDVVLSYGERVSKALLLNALKNEGIKVSDLNAIDLIVARGKSDSVVIDYKATKTRLTPTLAKVLRSSKVALIEGFIASNSEGFTVTLGRGGSDYTASSIASLVNAEEVHLITDVPGVFTADPTYVDNVKVVRNLSLAEALEASRHNVKRLHIKTFEPMRLFNYPRVLKIRSFDSLGTTISRVSNGNCSEGVVKTIAVKTIGKNSEIVLIGEGIRKNIAVIRKTLETLEKSVNLIENLRLSSSKASLILEIPAINHVKEVVREIHDAVIG
ncbi:MAG: hypothetical protein B7O98_03545 [Zestosphaera tikiterensis]|uniref:Aspartate/glutamate/uridylate kinase domain-containing protein n=1 Tax=Zestosphaera tikiterensis TaxID=1973259 RepID=A0A2R7Y7I1_9CREN|nr:MAG: hypothetical protein B7O98_03545 [Zestosphaera tikiterensis]